jgi:hypothetical protein
MPTENSNLSTGAGIEIPDSDPAAPAAPPAAEPDGPTREELELAAEQFGLDSTRFQTRNELAEAIEKRRLLIAGFDREIMLELLRWGRRLPPVDATGEQLAREITAIRSMKFGGLSRGALVVLAHLRHAVPADTDDIPTLIHKLKHQEGLFEKLARKKRAFIGKLVSNLVGENDEPPRSRSGNSPAATATAAREASIKEEIEEAGLLSGISNRLKRTADQYLNQKLDEIEARIDRKLEEIDRRLGQWRDREVANRLKILKITLWASVIVAIVSLIYSWLKVYISP